MILKWELHDAPAPNLASILHTDAVSARNQSTTTSSSHLTNMNTYDVNVSELFWTTIRFFHKLIRSRPYKESGILARDHNNRDNYFHNYETSVNVNQYSVVHESANWKIRSFFHMINPRWKILALWKRKGVLQNTEDTKTSVHVQFLLRFIGLR